MMAMECTMPLDITYQPVNVLIDHHNSEGKLIFADAQLTAVIVRLDGQAHDPEHKGRWHLEAGFGQCQVSGNCRKPTSNSVRSMSPVSSRGS